MCILSYSFERSWLSLKAVPKSLLLSLQLLTLKLTEATIATDFVPPTEDLRCTSINISEVGNIIWCVSYSVFTIWTSGMLRMSIEMLRI